MRRAFLFLISVSILILFCSCEIKEQNNLSVTDYNSVTFINDVNDADIWILPQTEKNLKTTVWGTATVSGTLKGESYPVSLCEPGDDGYYVFRMIDKEGFYYSANGLILKNNWTVKISGESFHQEKIYETDERGGRCRRGDHAVLFIKKRLLRGAYGRACGDGAGSSAVF